MWKLCKTGEMYRDEAREKGKVDNNSEHRVERIFAMLCPAICDPLNAEVRLYQCVS